MPKVDSFDVVAALVIRSSSQQEGKCRLWCKIQNTKLALSGGLLSLMTVAPKVTATIAGHQTVESGLLKPGSATALTRSTY